MDTDQISAVVIPLDEEDDDDDDDVVFVKEEKAPEDAGKDDVIFVSEEPSQKNSSETKKNNRNKDKGSVANARATSRAGAGGSAGADSSAGTPGRAGAGDSDSCTVTLNEYVNSSTSLASFLDDILKPLNTSHTLDLTTGTSPLALTKQITKEPSCSTVPVPDIQKSFNNASDDWDITLMDNFLAEFGSVSSKSVNDSLFASTSGISHSFSPLTLSTPHSVTPLSPETSNASVFETDIVYKEYCATDNKNATITTGALNNMFFTTGLEGTDTQLNTITSLSAHKSGQKDAVCKSTNSALVDGNTHVKDVIPCIDKLQGLASDALKCPPVAYDVPALTSFLDSSLGFEADTCNTKNMASKICFSEKDPKSGSSEQYRSAISSLNSTIGSSDLYFSPRTKQPGSTTSASLDFNSLDSEDLISLFSLVPDNKLQAVNKKENHNTGLKAHGNIPKEIDEISHLVSTKEQSESSLASISVCKTSLNDAKFVCMKDSNTTFPLIDNSDVHNSKKISGMALSNDKKPTPCSKPFSFGDILVSAVKDSFKPSKTSCQLIHDFHPQKRNLYKREYDCQIRRPSCKSSMETVSDGLNGIGKSNSLQWTIVSSESQRREGGEVSRETPGKKRKCEKGMPSLKVKLKLSAPVSAAVLSSKTAAPCQPSDIGLKKSIIRRHTSLAGETHDKGFDLTSSIHRSLSENGLKESERAANEIHVLCVICEKSSTSDKLSKCGKGHGICATCLEPQVKVILTGDVKQKNIKCLFKTCVEIISFDELKQTLPPFVVDVLEEKLDKEYMSYITNWMFTDEQLKSRSEFATLDTGVTHFSDSTPKLEKVQAQELSNVAAGFPAFWVPTEHGTPVMAFQVVPDTEEYRALAISFHETLAFGDYDIVRIIRIQNPILWKYFSLKQSEMVQDNHGLDVVEKQLYHGTHHSTLEAIARKGFDWRLSGKHGSAFGYGSYFANAASYSHGYTDCAGSGVSIKAGGWSSYMNRARKVVHSHHNPYRQKTALNLSVSSSFSSASSQKPSLFNNYPQAPLLVQKSSCSQLSTPTSAKDITSGQTSRLFGQPSNLFSLDSCLGSSSTSSTSSQSLVNSIFSSYAGISGNLLQSPSTQNTCFNSSQIRSSYNNLGNSYSSSSSSSNNLGHLQNVPSLVLGDLLNSVTDSKYIKTEPVSRSTEDLQDQGDNKSTDSYTVKNMCSLEKGTVDLTAAFSRGPDSKSHFMFVARVLVGRHTGGKSGLKRPPPLDESNPYGKCYDSCVDNIFSPQIYVIFDSNQAYPEYVIEYNCLRG